MHRPSPDKAYALWAIWVCGHAPSPSVIVAAGLLALVVLLTPGISRVVGYVVLIAHEGGHGLAGVAWWLPVEFKSSFAYLVTWILLLGGPLRVVEFFIAQRSSGWNDTDPGTLAERTGVGATVWVAVFLAVDVAALVLGSRWLL